MHGRVAFITTPNFRKDYTEAAKDFVYRHMYSLCNSFEVLSTGGTFDFVRELLDAGLRSKAQSLIAEDMGLPAVGEREILLWRESIQRTHKRMRDGVQGMIEVAYELVEGRLGAVIHLTEWHDLDAKPDSAVLWREANVYNVPIAHDVTTASAFVSAWNSMIRQNPDRPPLFAARRPLDASPLRDIQPGARVLGLIAHDNKKLEMCAFAVENAARIFRRFDYILATGTTGERLIDYMQALGRSPNDIERIRRCHSGPYGGDVQIAFAVVQRLCQMIIFLQDPLVSHPHDSDIRLFEQAVLQSDVDVLLVTNVQGARFILRE